MMKILKRYVLLEVLNATLGAMALFCGILLAGNVLQELAGRLADGRISLEVFVQLIALLIPFVAAFSLPLGMLTGILIGIGKLSSSREIVAMKANGVSIWGISMPVFLLAILGVFASLAANNYIAPVARTTYKKLMVNALRTDPLRFFKAGVISRDFPGYVFYIESKKDQELRGFWIWELDKQGQPSLFIRADEGSIRYERANDTLVLTLKNGIAERWQAGGKGKSTKDNPLEAAMITFEELPLALSLEHSLGQAKTRRSLADHSLPELLALISEKKDSGASAQEFSEFRSRIHTQISSNCSLAFSILSLSLVAIPLAIKTGRKETYANAMLALGLGLFYYFLTSLITSLKLPPELHPEWVIWSPNLILLAAGAYLMRRVYLH